MWASGSDLSMDDTGASHISAFAHDGEDGGFVIGSVNLSTYFDVITIANEGNVFGGAGGGGGGVLGVSAEAMPAVSALSAGSGGGGGRGIHNHNAGVGGLAAVSAAEDDDGNITYTQNPDFGDIYVSNGSAGSTSAGGAGGALTDLDATISLLDPSDTVMISAFPAMSGLSGGDFGLPGQTDGNVPVLPFPPVGNTGTGFSTISSEWAVRAGGAAGYIVDGTITSVTSSGLGTTKGTGLLGI